MLPSPETEDVHWLLHRWLYVRCYIKEDAWRAGVGGAWVHPGNFNTVSSLPTANGPRLSRSWILEAMSWKDTISSSFYNKKFLRDYKQNLGSICIDAEYLSYLRDVSYLEIPTCNRLTKTFNTYVSHCAESLLTGLALDFVALLCPWEN